MPGTTDLRSNAIAHGLLAMKNSTWREVETSLGSKVAGPGNGAATKVTKCHVIVAQLGAMKNSKFKPMTTPDAEH
jgi:hypothetical protein